MPNNAIPLASSVEAAARKLQIRFRKFSLSKDTIYFCTLPNLLKFNLSVWADGPIKLWRLVDAPLSKSKTLHLECRDDTRPELVLGISSTEDGMFRIYAEAKLDPESPDVEQELQHLLTGYCRIIQKPPFAGHNL